MKHPVLVRNFLNDIIELCKKHQLSLAHEDHHGAFIVEKFDVRNIDWLLDAFDEIDEETNFN